MSPPQSTDPLPHPDDDHETTQRMLRALRQTPPPPIRERRTHSQPAAAATAGPIIDYPTVARVEVIDSTGRAYTAQEAANVFVQLQDEGTTLKVFLRNPTRNN